MKTLRILTSVLLAAALLALVAGCGGGGDDDELLPEAIAYMAEPNGSDDEMWIMAPDGSGKLLVMRYSGGDAMQGLLSPNGRKLLYVAYLYGDSALIEKDLNTGDLQVLLNDEDSFSELTPAYSPNGAKIAYRDEDSDDIYVMNADGTGITALTSDPERDIAPAWSRNGQKIAFVRGGYWGSVWIMNADGSGQTVVKAMDDDYEYMTPQFLPDGRIVVVRDGQSKDIVVMNIDGTGVINLTPDTDDTDEFAPTVNRAGNRIAFATDRNGHKDVYIGTFNGTTISNLTNLTEDVDYNCWRPRFGVVDPNYLAITNPVD